MKGWKDNSGYARHFTESTYPPFLKKAQQQGRDVVRFNGSNSRLKTGSFFQGQPWTGIMACRIYDNYGNFQAIFINPTGFPWVFWRSFSSIAIFFNAGVSLMKSWTNPDNQPVIFTVVANGGSSKIQIGTETPTVGNASSIPIDNGIQIAKYATYGIFTDMEVYEFVGYDGVLSDGDLALILAYLKARWVPENYVCDVTDHLNMRGSRTSLIGVVLQEILSLLAPFGQWLGLSHLHKKKKFTAMVRRSATGRARMAPEKDAEVKR